MDKSEFVKVVDTSIDAHWLQCDHPHLWVKDGVCGSCGQRLEAAPKKVVKQAEVVSKIDSLIYFKMLPEHTKLRKPTSGRGWLIIGLVSSGIYEKFPTLTAAAEWLDQKKNAPVAKSSSVTAVNGAYDTAAIISVRRNALRSQAISETSAETDNGRFWTSNPDHIGYPTSTAPYGEIFVPALDKWVALSKNAILRWAGAENLKWQESN
jgi:hypothetical protein